MYPDSEFISGSSVIRQVLSMQNLYLEQQTANKSLLSMVKE